jgi:hypothetical protein
MTTIEIPEPAAMTFAKDGALRIRAALDLSDLRGIEEALANLPPDQAGIDADPSLLGGCRRASADLVGWGEPTGPAFGRPDDKLREAHHCSMLQLMDIASLHPSCDLRPYASFFGTYLPRPHL